MSFTINHISFKEPEGLLKTCSDCRKYFFDRRYLKKLPKLCNKCLHNYEEMRTVWISKRYHSQIWLSAENRQEGNRLPLEYMADDAEKTERFKTLVETHIRDYRKRQKLLKNALTDEDLAGFRERNLSDTQYITREVYNLLNDHLQFAENSPFAKKPVRAVNGAVTDYMRKRLGLHKNRADGDLHHAMDAAVVAITTDGMIQKISNYAKRRERGQKVRSPAKRISPYACYHWKAIQQC